jgi:hypothetical protein
MIGTTFPCDIHVVAILFDDLMRVRWRRHVPQDRLLLQGVQAPPVEAGPRMQLDAEAREFCHSGI